MTRVDDEGEFEVESDGLLAATSAPFNHRNASISSNNNKHQQIPSDDDDDDLSDYDAAYTGTKPKKHKRSSSKSQYSQLNKHKSDKKMLYIILIVICLLLCIAIVLVVYFMVMRTENITPTEPPKPFNNTRTATPTLDPTYFPTPEPTIYPTFSPSMFPTFLPSISPTAEPTMEPTMEPTLEPTLTPSMNPSKTPTPEPSLFPSHSPSYIPSSDPTLDPTTGPTVDPTFDPTNGPSSDPTSQPSIFPSNIPSLHPTQTPTMNPSGIPTSNPSRSPTLNPSENPSWAPTKAPTRVPTNVPTLSPTKNPWNVPTNSPTLNPTTSNPTISPTKNPTASPISRILRVGNTIIDQGITMTFPPDAFPDSLLTITIGEASLQTKDLFADTTSASLTMNIDGINNNAIHFEVENMPLDTPDISYKTSIPIPTDLITQCPIDYGFEIFTQILQNEYPSTTFPIFVLFPSSYDPIAQTLTTQLLPEMFHNFAADIILSCTPGANVVPLNNRRRRLLQHSDWATLCKAAEIICPVKGTQCDILKPFGRNHYAVDYFASTDHQIVASSNGVIERSDVSPSYGQMIVLRHDDGSATLYAFLSQRNVSISDVVVQGEVIGMGGTTHLHFEYIPNGQIYASKQRIDASHCFPPVPAPTFPSIDTTARPTQAPLVPPNTHSPTPSPTLYLPQGSITVRDSGRLADDSFAVYINRFPVCETEIGQLNTCAISFLRPGQHTLTLEVLVAPDGWGTFQVRLNDGWMFVDGTTSKDYEGSPPEGYKESWDFIVPFD